MPSCSRTWSAQLLVRFSRILAVAFAIVYTAGVSLAQEAADAAPQAAAGENMLVKTWNALGTMYAIVFLLMSVILVALVVRGILAVQKANFVPEDLVQGIEASLAENNPQAAAELVKADESFLGNLLNAGLGQVTKGKDAALEAMQVAGDAETMRVEHMISYIALIGNIAPMVGLLGTVQGMIIAFYTTANLQAGANRAAELASGIYLALITTFAGLCVAIPAAIIAHYLEGRILAGFRRVDDVVAGLLPAIESFEGRGRSGGNGRPADPSAGGGTV